MCTLYSNSAYKFIAPAGTLQRHHPVETLCSAVNAKSGTIRDANETDQLGHVNTEKNFDSYLYHIHFPVYISM